jgi:hypothetical protein
MEIVKTIESLQKVTFAFVLLNILKNSMKKHGVHMIKTINYALILMGTNEDDKMRKKS